ncbi:MAG: hypothetical protein IKQ70_04955 [Bacteroidales bacterium]|nr:hypothetical protein [Bacteroidales bacterium]
MKKLLSLIFFLFCFSASYADGGDPDLFSDAGIAEKFATADSIAISNFTDSAMPGRMPTFLFTSIVSAVGTYTLYGAGAGPIAVAIVYACKHGDRREVKLAIFGCLTGAAVGGLIKWLTVK